MTDITYDFEMVVDAPVHAVFEYCRDPRTVYAGDPTHAVLEATAVPEGVGTRALIHSRTGPIDEIIALEYVVLVPDERIVFEARPTATLRGLSRPVFPGALHTWTWTFRSQEKTTLLSLRVVAHDTPLLERLMNALTLGSGTRMFRKEITGRLDRIKKAVEKQAAPVQ